MATGRSEARAASGVQAVLVTPLTGPLARFGRAGATALELWAREAPATLEVVDAHPDPAAAMARGRDRGGDVLFGPYGSGPAVAALAAVAGPAGPAVWNHGGATSRLAWPEFPRVLNVLAPASTYFQAVVRAVRAADPSAHTIALLHAETGFAIDVASGVGPVAAELGFDLDAVPFHAGQAVGAAAHLSGAALLLVVGSFEDEVAAARALLEDPARPWRAAAFVGAGVEDVLADLGVRREGLLAPTQWSARAALTVSPDEGPDAGWFREAYRQATGDEPDYPAAQAFAAGVLAARCLSDAGSSDDERVVASAVRLRCRTMYGAFGLDPYTGRQVAHRVLVVQWQDGARRVVWPPEQAERPLRLLGRQE